MSEDYHFGLDHDLAQKRAALYDQGLEDELRQWIESTTGEKIPGKFMEGLKSGIILCNLGNKISPGSCKSKQSTMPFVIMENINSFLNFMKSKGVATTDLFMTVDLFEGKNPNQVLQGLLALKRITTGVKSGGAAKSSNTVFSTTSQNNNKFCSQCGTKAADPGARFCGSCGSSM